MNQKTKIMSGDFGLEHQVAGRRTDPPVNGESTIAYPPSATTSNMQLAYSMEHAAQALDVGLSLIKQLVHVGELASVRIGRRRLISRTELERFLALREKESRLTERARGQLEARIDDLRKMLDELGGGRG